MFTEIIRNAIMEYLFRFDDRVDAKMLNSAIEQDEPRSPLNEVVKRLSLE